MPGFISTHNHQYEAVQRSILSDGLIIFAGDADQEPTDTTQNIFEAYGTVVQSIWTSGRIGTATSPQWDLGRSPYDPEDCYNAELIACLSQIGQGITCGTDTSQCSHTPQHTDAMIQACIDSGRRTLFDYSPGINRNPNQATPPAVPAVRYNVPTDPYEYPDGTTIFTAGQKIGLQRIAKRYFSSKDQLVTLGFAGAPTPIANLPAPYTGLNGWTLAREFGAFINAHNVGGSTVPSTALGAHLAPFDDCHSRPLQPLAGSFICPNKLRRSRLSSCGHIGGDENLGRQRWTRFERRPHRATNAAWHAGVPAVSQSWDFAEP